MGFMKSIRIGVYGVGGLGCRGVPHSGYFLGIPIRSTASRGLHWN